MKKIYTTLALQPIKMTNYGDENHKYFPNCQHAVEVPIIAFLSDIIEGKEKFKIVALHSMHSEASENNLNKLKDALDKYYPDQYELIVPEATLGPTRKEQIQAFKAIYKTVEEGDSIYFDITFGNKPMPMTTLVALNYASHFVEDVKVERIVYALFSFEHKDDKDFIHSFLDVTSIYALDVLVNTLIENNTMNPDVFIDKIFGE